jgi:hypothetical protein
MNLSLITVSQQDIEIAAVALFIEQIPGFGGMVEEFGVLPTIIAFFGGVIVMYAIFFDFSTSSASLIPDEIPGVTSLISSVVPISKPTSLDDIAPSTGDEQSGTSPSTTASSSLKTADEEIIEEATRRLKEENKDITGEHLETKVAEVTAEIESDETVKETGLGDTSGAREAQQKLQVAAEEVEFHTNHFTLVDRNGEKKFCRVMIINDYPSQARHGWLDQVHTSGLDTPGAQLRVDYRVNPIDSKTAMKMLKKRATRLTSTINRKHSKGKINTTEEKNDLQTVDQLRNAVDRGTTKLVDFAAYFEIVGDDKETLDKATQEFKSLLRSNEGDATPLYDRQLDGSRSIAPLGQDFVGNGIPMTLEALGTMFPFTDPNIIDKNGVLMGWHQATGSPVVVDRFNLSGHNMLISGKIGSGKSYLAKLLMLYRYLNDPTTEISIIDPVGGLGSLTNELDGQQIEFSRDTIINPLEIREVEDESVLDEIDGHPYEDKLSSIMGMFKAHFEESGTQTLNKKKEGVLRRAVRYAYIEKGILKDINTHHRENPTIQDVLDILHHMSEKRHPSDYLDVPDSIRGRLSQFDLDVDTRENSQKVERFAKYAQDVLLGLEDFRRGGQHDQLNGKTNVELDAQVVQFDLSGIAEENNDLYMHIVLDWLFQRAKSSTTNNLVTIDEAHYMLRNSQSLRLLNLFTRHSRHFNSGVTLISQTVDEFVNNDLAKEIYDQCDVRALMHHEDMSDESIESLGLSESDRQFVLQAQSGNSAGYSESLVYVSGVGKMQVTVRTYELYHKIIEEGPNPYVDAVKNGLLAIEDVPQQHQPEVHAAIEREREGIA